MKDLGVLKYLFGVEVARNSKGIYLCQRKDILDFVAKSGNLGSKPVSFPMEEIH